MQYRTLNEIEEDLHKCAEYNRIRTPDATLRFCEDLRVNMLALIDHIKALRLETYQPPEETTDDR